MGRWIRVIMAVVTVGLIGFGMVRQLDSGAAPRTQSPAVTDFNPPVLQPESAAEAPSALAYSARGDGPLVVVPQHSGIVSALDTGDFTIWGHEPLLRNNILLTIDDCIYETKTRRMFNLIRDEGLTATFFPNTEYMLKHDPKLWREIVAAGFEIGYHTRHHRAHMQVAELNQDFLLFQTEVRAVLGDPTYIIHYVRPPYGKWDSEWMAWAKQNELYTVRWNIVPPVDMTYIRSILKSAHGGGIILLHAKDRDIAWLEEYLDDLVALRDGLGQPYRLVSLTDALRD